MQEVFEKIIEKLKEVGKLEISIIGGRCNGKTLSLGYKKGIENAIEIVKQEAAEYNNGWIPCSERLPEEYEDVEVTIEEIANDVGGKRYYNVRSWLQDGQWIIKKNPYNPTVIAWKYPTQPYQPKGE